jgi:hypothetical protein
MSLFLQIDPNPNCDALDGMLFQPRTESRGISQLRYERHGEALWCEVVGVEHGGTWAPALACKIDDSGDGSCYLVYGGTWGLRLRVAGAPSPWDLSAPTQWGETYLLLGGDATDLKFS